MKHNSSSRSELRTASTCDTGRPRQALQEKLQQVRTILRGWERVLIAFSGGVDSSLLAKLARDELGRERVLAATADSPSLARAELGHAVEMALGLDVPHLVVATQEVTDPAYRANTSARCYFCKRHLFTELEALARGRHIPVVLYGAIGDDVPAERPGQRAAAQFGVLAPLQEVGLAKWEVRELARQLGLPNWDKPQNACLSSRIPHGIEVTEEKLRQVEYAEAFLRAQGFRQVRVRHLGARARIEVGRDEVGRLGDEAFRQSIAIALAQLGFSTIVVDPGGYRPGGANRAATGDGR